MQTKSLKLLVVLMVIALGLHTVVGQRKRPSKRSAPAVKPVMTIVAGSGSDLLSTHERGILDEINLARANPSEYVKVLENFKQYYQGKQIHFPDGHVLVTNEGVGALDEAIRFVRALKPLPPLEIRKGMVLGAKAHVDDLCVTGGSGHKGSDGSKVEDRLNRYGTWRDAVGEDIVYDSRKAREDVIALIIDDGVATRGHRKNIFKPGFRVIGIAMGQPTKSTTMCVITFAGEFADKAESKAGPTAQKY